MLSGLELKGLTRKMSVPGSRAGVWRGESVPAGAIAHTNLPKWVVFSYEKDKMVKILIFLGKDSRNTI